MFRIPDTHDNFTLSKKEHDDQTIGFANPKPIICKFCRMQILGKNQASKIAK
jgi:hypothetical protein